jgi:hypothetical protein
MTSWPLIWLILLTLGVGGFAAVSVMIAVKGFGELKAILRKLERDAGVRPSRKS